MPVEVPGGGGPRREALEQLGQEDYGPLELEQEDYGPLELEQEDYGPLELEQSAPGGRMVDGVLPSSPWDEEEEELVRWPEDV